MSLVYGAAATVSLFVRRPVKLLACPYRLTTHRLLQHGAARRREECCPEQYLKMEFKRMLLELSRRIRDTDLAEMKHLCSDQVPVSRQEKIQTSLQLFQELEELGELDENNVELLKSILLSRKDLFHLVVAFQQGSWEGPESQSLLSLQRELEKDFDIVSENLTSREWQKLARQLGVSDTDIDNITSKYHGNVREQIRQVLRRWSETTETASRQTLLAGLKACSMNNTAYVLETSRRS